MPTLVKYLRGTSFTFNGEKFGGFCLKKMRLRLMLKGMSSRLIAVVKAYQLFITLVGTIDTETPDMLWRK